MIGSTHNVNENFYAELIGESFANRVLSLTTNNNTAFDVNIIYARAGALDFSQAAVNRNVKNEEPEIKYPILSVANYSPKLKEGYYFTDQKVYGNFRDTDADGKVDKVSVIPQAIPLLFKYDVAIACKSEGQWEAFKMYMLGRFELSKQKCFVFNKKVVPLVMGNSSESVVGDFVKYDLVWNDTYRTDGVFETVYTFTLHPWVQVKDFVEDDTLETINIRINNRLEVSIEV